MTTCELFKVLLRRNMNLALNILAPPKCTLPSMPWLGGRAGQWRKNLKSTRRECALSSKRLTHAVTQTFLKAAWPVQFHCADTTGEGRLCLNYLPFHSPLMTAWSKKPAPKGGHCLLFSCWPLERDCHEIVKGSKFRSPSGLTESPQGTFLPRALALPLWKLIFLLAKPFHPALHCDRLV